VIKITAERAEFTEDSIERFEPVHVAQVLSYLRLSGHQVGLLMNFNVKWLTDQGLKRLVLGQLKS